MKNRALLVESMDTLKLGSGFVMQIESGGERYVFLTGAHTCTDYLILNAADIPTYDSPEISGFISRLYEDVRETNSIMRTENPLAPRYFTAHGKICKEALEDMKTLKGVDIGPLSMDETEKLLKRELSKHRSGALTFRDRLVPKWKGKSRLAYRTVNIPGSVFDRGVPPGVKGAGMYEMKEGGLYISDEKPDDYRSVIVGVHHMELPGINRNFADYAGRIPITYL